MRKITATIVTYNDEEQIERCLKSLQGVADEIIVVDSFSTDATVDICTRYGCTVTHRQFTGYGAQKQYAVSLSNHSYILSIDTDEYLDEELRHSIIKLKEDGFSHRIYSLNRLNYFCNVPIRHCGWFPDRPIRLFDKRYASWNLRDVNEAVIFPGTLRPYPLKGLIMHHKCHSLEEHRRKEERYASINARILVNEDRCPMFITGYIKAFVTFIRIYVFWLGFLDGSPGWDISMTAAQAAAATCKLARKHYQSKS